MELLHRVYGLLAGRKIAVFMIEGEDWNADLSPWEAPPVFKAAPPFAGKASGYLSFLCGQVIPQTERRLSISVQKRSLSGYSLAGLFSVYAMYRSALFTEVASVSGSLWFDGFLDYMKENVPLKKPDRVYFSLGAKEKETRNPRMAKVEACTLAAKEYLEGLGIPCLFESNAGGHFHQAQERIEKAIFRLCISTGQP